jgi:3-hydroxymyristoyl/3-hydroxydecanoyl-(acyl carrier protein) dehydratase
MKFRLVDRILDWEPRSRIRGVKAVSFEEYSLRDPLGDGGRLPESLLLESLFQLGNWLVVLSSDFRSMGLVIRLGRAEFLEAAGPGTRLELDVTVRSWRDDGILFDGRARARGRTIAAGEGCLAVPAPLEGYEDPVGLRTLFGEIHRPLEAAP